MPSSPHNPINPLDQEQATSPNRLASQGETHDSPPHALGRHAAPREHSASTMQHIKKDEHANPVGNMEKAIKTQDVQTTDNNDTGGIETTAATAGMQSTGNLRGSGTPEHSRHALSTGAPAPAAYDDNLAPRASPAEHPETAKDTTGSLPPASGRQGAETANPAFLSQAHWQKQVMDSNKGSSVTSEPSARPLLLRSTAFRKKREDSWQTLNTLVNKVEKKTITSLNAKEVQSLPFLYRSAVSSLSVARTIVLDRNLLLYLENLCLRSYLVVYGPRSSISKRFSSFIRHGFPLFVRNAKPHFILALTTFLAGLLTGFLLVCSNLDFYSLFIPDAVAQGRTASTSPEELKNILFAQWSGFEETFIYFANSLFRHNTVVGILCFGLGFAMGIPTILLLLYNGCLLGAFIGLHYNKGLFIDCIGWLSIHGVTEILAILLCGTAGLILGQSVLFPGKLTRLQSLAKYGQQAASIAAGSILLFFLAGILEGGFRQLLASTPIRYGVAFGTAAFWLWYFTQCGKNNGTFRDGYQT